MHEVTPAEPRVDGNSPINELIDNLKQNARAMRPFSMRLPAAGQLLTAFVAGMILRGDHTSDDENGRVNRDVALHLAIEDAEHEDVVKHMGEMSEKKAYDGPMKDAKTMLIGGTDQRLIISLIPERGTPTGIAFKFEDAIKFADRIRETVEFLSAKQEGKAS